MLLSSVQGHLIHHEYFSFSFVVAREPVWQFVTVAIELLYLSFGIWVVFVFLVALERACMKGFAFIATQLQRFSFQFSVAAQKVSFFSCQIQWLCNTPRLFNLHIAKYIQNWQKLPSFGCAMWNLLGKQCDRPEDPVCHADLTFLPPDGSFRSFGAQEGTFDFSVKTWEEQREPQSFSETYNAGVLIWSGVMRSKIFWSLKYNYQEQFSNFYGSGTCEPIKENQIEQ